MLAEELPIVLDRRRGEPLAVQVADSLRAAASSGVLRVGDRLTSTRALARRLGVSRTVTAAAYDQLLAEGWLAGRRGAGTYVTAAPPGTDRTRPADQRPDRHRRTEHLSAGRRPIERSGGPGLDRRPADPVADLTAGRPCLAALDRAAWRRAWRAAADVAPSVEPDYAGRPEFRHAVVDHLLRHRGLAAGPDQVLATAGRRRSPRRSSRASRPIASTSGSPARAPGSQRS